MNISYKTYKNSEMNFCKEATHSLKSIHSSAKFYIIHIVPVVVPFDKATQSISRILKRHWHFISDEAQLKDLWSAMPILCLKKHPCQEISYYVQTGQTQNNEPPLCFSKNHTAYNFNKKSTVECALRRKALGAPTLPINVILYKSPETIK